MLLDFVGLPFLFILNLKRMDFLLLSFSKQFQLLKGILECEYISYSLDLFHLALMSFILLPQLLTLLHQLGSL